MKKIVILLLIVFTFASCTQKIGYVNTEKLIKEYKGTEVVEAEMKVKSEKFQKEIEMLVAGFQAKVADYQKKAKRMSSKKRAQAEQELGVEQQMIQQKQQQVQYQVQNDGQAEIKKIAEKVNDFVKEYAKKNGYKFILGTVDLNGAVMYGDDEADITYKVLKAMNNSYKKDDNSSSTKEEDKKESTPETKKEEETKK